MCDRKSAARPKKSHCCRKSVKRAWPIVSLTEGSGEGPVSIEKQPSQPVPTIASCHHVLALPRTLRGSSLGKTCLPSGKMGSDTTCVTVDTSRAHTGAGNRCWFRASSHFEWCS